jgi:hypothetical protein
VFPRAEGAPDSGKSHFHAETLVRISAGHIPEWKWSSGFWQVVFPRFLGCPGTKNAIFCRFQAWRTRQSNTPAQPTPR